MLFHPLNGFKATNMKRRNFLFMSLLAIPVASFTKLKNFIRAKLFRVDAGKDRFDKPLSLFERRHFLL